MKSRPTGPVQASAPPITPLAKWLRETSMTQAALRAACREVSGLDVRAPVMSRWVRGQAVPNQHSRALLEKATGGGVPAEAWAPFVRKTRGNAPASSRRRGAR